MSRSFPGAFVVLLAAGACASPGDREPRELQPPPVQQPIAVERLPLDGSVRREEASPLASVRAVPLPRDETDTGAAQLLGDGTLYRLELDRLGQQGAALIRFDDLAGTRPVATRIPFVAPAGQQIRTDYGGRGLRVATGSAGILMDRNRRGSVWWEEDGPKGRLIEFTIDGDQATMVPPGESTDDPNAPVAHRFNSTHDREVPYRFTTGAVNVGRGVPHAFLGGRGFSLAVTPIGSDRVEAFLESPAVDLPDVDVAEPAPGLLTVTIGYIAGRGHATQVTYDRNAGRWQDHRPLVVFSEAQGVEVADVGRAGALVVLGLPWTAAQDDPETGLYWVQREQPVRHLLQRVRNLHTATLPDGFVALFHDDFRRDRSAIDPEDILVLQAQGGRLALHRFPRPGLASASHFAWIGGGRFIATFGATEVIIFDVPLIK